MADEDDSIFDLDALKTGLIVAGSVAVVVIVLCCCFGARRKRQRSSSRPAPIRPIVPANNHPPPVPPPQSENVSDTSYNTYSTQSHHGRPPRQQTYQPQQYVSVQAAWVHPDANLQSHQYSTNQNTDTQAYQAHGHDGTEQTQSPYPYTQTVPVYTAPYIEPSAPPASYHVHDVSNSRQERNQQSSRQQTTQNEQQAVRFSTEDLLSFDASEEEKTNPCPICLGSLGDEPISTGQCLHLIHTSCLKSWLAKDNRSACPVCRVTYSDEIHTSQVTTAPLQAPQHPDTNVGAT